VVAPVAVVVPVVVQQQPLERARQMRPPVVAAAERTFLTRTAAPVERQPKAVAHTLTDQSQFRLLERLAVRLAELETQAPLAETWNWLAVRLARPRTATQAALAALAVVLSQPSTERQQPISTAAVVVVIAQ
jgi:hypothetical protein